MEIIEKSSLITFNDVESLYNDMVTYNQSFTKSEDIYHNNNLIIEGQTIYRLVEIINGKLQFHSNKFGGSVLSILGNIIAAEKVDVDENGICEYRFTIEGLGNPLILVGCKKRD